MSVTEAHDMVAQGGLRRSLTAAMGIDLIGGERGVRGGCGRDGRRTPGHSHGGLAPDRVLERLDLRPGHSFLDAGCGEGRFSIPAAGLVGSKGKVYAVDTSEARIASLRRVAQEKGLDQIQAFVADVTQEIPIEADTVDVCLMANVFHGLAAGVTVRGELREIKRVLRPKGALAILDFRKDVDRPPGPPIDRRIDPVELEGLISQYGFRQRTGERVGSYHYLSIFVLDDATA
jgi:ubiquinone/menaquinone biosynthesis C-methylase UbiE